MEEAASMLGAGTARTTFTVTLPLVLPAILAGGALVVLESVVNFGVPAIIGMPVHVESLTTRIYRTFQFPPEYHMAAVTAVPIVMIVAACVVIQWLALGKRTFVTVGGASSQPRIVELGRLRYAMTGFALLVMTGSIFLPCGALLVTSLKQTFGFPFGLDNLTMGHFADVWLASTTRRAVYNSVLLASGAALVCMGLALVLAWLVERTTLPGRSAVTALVMACFSFPGIALAVALIFAFSTPPLDIYGTMWILLLAYSIHGLPIVFNYARIGLKQVHIELTDAAEILGASWRRAFWQITVPLIRGGLVAGGLIVFVLMLREFGSSVLLSAAGTEVIAVTIYEFAEEGDNGRMAALAVSVYIVNLLVVLGARGLTQGKS